MVISSKTKLAEPPLRSGSLTVLVAAVTVLLAVLAVLALATARADLAMAQRQQSRLTLELRAETAGQQWLADADAWLAGMGALPANTIQGTDGSLTAHLPLEQGETLAVTIIPATGETRYTITAWFLQADWDGEETLQLWSGTPATT